MKRITLLLTLAFSALVLSGTTFAQTVTWLNPVTAVEQGQAITLDIAYTGAPSANPGFIQAGIGPAANQFAYPPITVMPDGTLSVNYTIPADAALGNTDMIIFWNEGGVNNNTPIEVVAPGTLSNSTFAKEELESAYYNGAGSIVITDDISGPYVIYNTAGIKASEGTITNSESINIEELIPSTYIFSTEAGTLKFTK